MGFIAFARQVFLPLPVILISLAALFWGDCSLAFGNDVRKKEILLLNSYHQGFAWTDSITEEIRTVFRESGLQVELHIEYLDVKRHDPESVTANFVALLRSKYAGHAFDAIVVSDDPAFGLALGSRSELFPGVPVIFCGLNAFKPELLAGHADVTGVVEDVDLQATLRLAGTLHPDARYVAVINDGSQQARAMMARVRRDMLGLAGRFELIELFDLSVGELETALRQLPVNTIILHVHYYTDKETGRTLSPEQSFGVTRGATKLPIYTGWDFQVGYGAVGGIVISGTMQGREAARLTLRVLQGEKAGSIPVLSTSPNVPLFDYRQLLEYNILINDLPEGRIVLHGPNSFYLEYKLRIWSVTAVFTLLIFYTFGLRVNIHKRKKLESQLRYNQDHLEHLIEMRTEQLSSSNSLLRQEISEREKIEAERERIIIQLETALREVKSLSGLLPICASCKKIRDDHGYWNQIEQYIKTHSDADFTHSICPECVKKLYPDIDLH